MVKKRIVLFTVSALAIWLIFQLPKAVVENEADVSTTGSDSVVSHIENHTSTPEAVKKQIRLLRAEVTAGSANQKNAIFADSLANLYEVANQFDSAAWFAEVASKFFNTKESWLKAGDNFYQAYTLAIDQSKQSVYAAKAQEYFGKILTEEPGNLDVKTKMALTYMTSKNPMQGIVMLREVIAKDPKNELALFNMGMLSIQSGQYARAIERLEELINVNPNHVQGRLLLGVAWMNNGDKAKAKEQFEKVKQMDNDPAVQATVDSYLNDLK